MRLCIFTKSAGRHETMTGIPPGEPQRFAVRADLVKGVEETTQGAILEFEGTDILLLVKESFDDVIKALRDAGADQ